jgi:hypothetical protein
MKLLIEKLNALEPVARLTTSEQRALQRAEGMIAKGMKAFVAVGMALKEIRDRRLYRERYGTFEEYCARRWELSRPRGYELCAAAEVVEDLSAIADSSTLPENEAQTRPLTRLKDPAQWRRAWHTAVKLAAAEKRPLTARDTEEGVRRLDGNGRIDSAGVDGEPVFNCIQGTNADLIATVARLYPKKGDRLADITFGRGVFWQRLNLSDYLFHKSDKITCPGSPHDFRRLPYPDDRFEVVVFDPPYAHGGYSMKSGPCYQLASRAGGLSHRDIMEGYERGMTEAARILKPEGTLWVKCADEIERSLQRRGHVEVFQIAKGLGLVDEDFFVLMQEGPPVTNGGRQQHARKNCSFLWVFRKPAR